MAAPPEALAAPICQPITWRAICSPTLPGVKATRAGNTPARPPPITTNPRMADGRQLVAAPDKNGAHYGDGAAQVDHEPLRQGPARSGQGKPDQSEGTPVAERGDTCGSRSEAERAPFEARAPLARRHLEPRVEHENDQPK